MKSALFLVFTLLATLSGFLVAQTDNPYSVPRTEYGQPDFQGVWNFSSNTPLQRPERFGDREFLTPEEAVAIREATLAATERGLDAGAGVGTYNTFWFEMAGRGDNIRTSLVTYPANGRVPPVIEGVVAVGSRAGLDVSGSRPVRFMVGGIGMDGPEDRGLSERCLVGFNAGPPFLPSAYNNNVQFFQSRDTVVIMTEMVHDARIVPLDRRGPLAGRDGPGLVALLDLDLLDVRMSMTIYASGQVIPVAIGRATLWWWKPKTSMT